MKKVLVICNMDPNSNPRPNRMIHWLKDDYEIEVAGTRKLGMEGIKSYVIGPAPKWADGQRFSAKLKRIGRRNFNFLRGNHEEVNASRLGDTNALAAELAHKEYDLIISHDLVLLPLVFHVKGTKTRVMLDAREYYPRHFDDRWLWRILHRPVNDYLCRKYLPRCDKVITVSDGLANEYKRVYGVCPEVIMSLPVGWAFHPLPSKADHIRMIHHGAAARSRKIETMLEMMDYVDERFTLDLMMVARDSRYWSRLVSRVKRRKNIQIVPPVSMQEIIPTTNQYDIGLFLVPPSNFNLQYALPNKLFEFIQARLAVAIGPSIEMSRIVRQFDCGVISQDFDPRSLANELNKLTAEKIMELKKHSHEAAQELNADTNAKRIREIVRDLIGTT
ncbi:MAG: capsular biosynthesis protein [Methanothrix sp.]|nr:MAG: capsular biosynthesis protein [Methanothrix sp.]